MNQQIAHRNVGVAQVGAEDVFAEELRKFAAGRMAAEEGAALMSRAVKLGMAVADIFFEAAEERREDGPHTSAQGCQSDGHRAWRRHFYGQ